MGKVPYHHGDLKTAILDAAEETLAEKSLDAVSMRELARKAGVSSGAPYHHFGDRVGLVGALCQRGFSRLHDVLIRGHDREGMRGMVKEYLSFAQENQALYQLMFSPEATESDLAEALTPYASPVFLLLEEVIKEGKNVKPKRRDNLTPVSVWCFMHGLATLSAASPLQIKIGRQSLNNFAYESIRKLIESGI